MLHASARGTAASALHAERSAVSGLPGPGPCSRIHRKGALCSLSARLLLLVRSGDEISGAAGYRSPSESARRSFVPFRAKRARANPPGDTSEVA